MRFREHRGGLRESLATTIEVQDRSQLMAHCRRLLAPYGFQFSDHQFHIIEYGEDPRIDWRPHSLVTIEGYGPMGMVECQPDKMKTGETT